MADFNSAWPVIGSREALFAVVGLILLVILFFLLSIVGYGPLAVGR